MSKKHIKFCVLLLGSLVVFSCATWGTFKAKLFLDTRVQSTLVKPLDVESFGKQTDFECVNATIRHLSFPMCLYDSASDKIISGMVRKKQFYETNLVMKAVNFLKANTDITFLDLGGNLGTYTLPMAHSKVPVISVEANKDNARRLAKSIYLGKIADTVDLFNYAVSDKISTTYLRFDSTNRGDTFMVGNDSCPGCLSVVVITLDCLIPFVKNKRVFIKADIQEAEMETFKRVGAGKFFSELDVVMVQMEWVLYPIRYAKVGDRRKLVDHFLEFFYQRGYDVYDPVLEKSLGPDWTKWPNDVLFKRTGLAKDKLYQI